MAPIPGMNGFLEHVERGEVLVGFDQMSVAFFSVSSSSLW